MNVIVAVDQNWGIGYNGRLLARLSDDMKRFKALTIGQTVILGRKTLETFPGGQPLPGRTNIIMTAQPAFQAGDARICHSLDELADCLDDLAGRPVFVIGGDSLYRQLLPFCKKAYVTRISRIFPADAFFPDLDRLEGWHLLEEGPLLTGISKIGNPDEALTFRFNLFGQDNPADLRTWLQRGSGYHEE